MGPRQKPSIKWIAFWGSIASIISLLLFVIMPSAGIGPRVRSHNVQGTGNNVAGGDINIDQAPKYRTATVFTNPITYLLDTSSPPDREGSSRFWSVEESKKHIVGEAEKGAEVTVIEERRTWFGLEAHVLVTSGRLSGKSGWVLTGCLEQVQLMSAGADK